MNDLTTDGNLMRKDATFKDVLHTKRPTDRDVRQDNIHRRKE